MHWRCHNTWTLVTTSESNMLTHTGSMSWRYFFSQNNIVQKDKLETICIFVCVMDVSKNISLAQLSSIYLLIRKDRHCTLCHGLDIIFITVSFLNWPFNITLAGLFQKVLNLLINLCATTSYAHYKTVHT